MSKYNKTHYKCFDMRYTPTSFFKCRCKHSDRHYYDDYNTENINGKLPKTIRSKEREHRLWEHRMTLRENNWKQDKKARKQYEWHNKNTTRRNKVENILNHYDYDINEILIEDYGGAA